MSAVLVTGASTGIGAACVLHLAEQGHLVFAGVRRKVDGKDLSARTTGRLVPVLLDVTDPESIAAAEATVRASIGTFRFGGLVNNAGIATGGALEFQSIAEVRSHLEVNVLGSLAVTQAFLPLVREGHGRIVFMGSVTGLVPTPMVGAYSASKYALEGIAGALRIELAPWRLAVAIVEPGPVKTPIWDKAEAEAARTVETVDPLVLERYGDRIAKARKLIARNAKHGIGVRKVVKAVDHALFAERPRARYPVGPSARAAAVSARVLPDRWLDAVISRTL